MLDVLWSIDDDYVQEEVVQHVLLCNQPKRNLVERLLYHIGGSDHLPSQVHV